MVRFVHSERDCITNLHAQDTNFCSVCPRQDVAPLCSVSAPACFENLFDVPKGYISDPPWLVNLLHTLKLSCVFNGLERSCMAGSSRNWVVDYQGVPSQEAFLKALSVDSKILNMASEVHRKVELTLQPYAPLDISVQWWGTFVQHS